MKQEQDPVLLWRVDLVHRNGYHAPYQLVEAKRSTVHREVRAMHLRLMDFPKKWSYHLYVISDDYNQKKGKWRIY